MASTGSSSLVVVISGDINDFSKQLDAMTRGVDKAVDHLTLVGDVLKVAITERVVEAGAKFLELGATAEATAARMDRTFGALAGSVKDSIEKMTAVVPETTVELEGLAIHLDNVVQGLGIAPSRAAAMSQSLLQVAADAAAVAHVPLPEALDAISHALSGRGRELIQFGIGFNQAEVKAYGLTHGLYDQGNQLSETGTALASFGLIMERAARIQGAAAQSVNDADRQVQFLKRDLKELGETVATGFLPYLLSIVDGARSVVDALAKVPTSVYLVTGAVLTFVAVLIPLGIGIAKAIQAFAAMRAALVLLSASSGVGGVVAFFASLTNPIGWVIAATAALTVAVLALVAAYEKLKGTNAADIYAKDKAVLDNDPALAGYVAKNFSAPEKNQPTQISTKTPFQELQETTGALAKLFDAALQHGQPIDRLMVDVNGQFRTAGSLMDSLNGKFDLASLKNKELVQSATDQLQRIRDIAAVSGAPTTAAAQSVLNQIARRPVDVGGLGAASAVDAANKYRIDLATRSAASQYATPFDAHAEAVIKWRADVQGSANDLALREQLLQLPDGFNAARVAAVQYAESQRQDQEQTALAFETLKIKLGPFGSALDGLSSGMQRAVVSIYDSVVGFANQLASTIGGSGKGAGTGRGIGGLIGGVIGAFGGPVGAAIGTFVGTAAGGLIGGAFDKNKQAVNNATTATNQLTASLQAANAAITNAPTFFLIGQYRYAAAGANYGAPAVPSSPITSFPGGGVPTPAGGGPSGAPGSPISARDIYVTLPNVKSADDFARQLPAAVLKARSTGSTARLALQGL